MPFGGKMVQILCFWGPPTMPFLEKKCDLDKLSIKHEKTPKSRNIVNKVSFAFFGGQIVYRFQN